MGNAYYKEKLFWKSIYGGLKSYLPKINEFRGTGGTDNSEYCYSVWLRHLSLADEHCQTNDKNHFLEIGPGDSLGVTFAAYLSGFKKCSAIETVDHVQADSILNIANSLLKYFEGNKPIPGNNVFPTLSPKIKDHAFKKENFMAVDFLDRKTNLLNWCHQFNNKNTPIDYKVADWTKNPNLFNDVDFILAQSVFQYLNTKQALTTINSWLKIGGLVSTQIDYSSHGLTKDFNGHWAIPNSIWSIIKGNRPFFINRLTHSETKSIIESCGFKVIYEQPDLRRSALSKDSSLIRPTRYQKLPASDFEISHCHFILQKI